MSTAKRILVLFSAALFAFAAVSCGGGDSGNNNADNNPADAQNQNGGVPGEEIAETTNRRDIPDNLPDTDLGGRDFNLLCHEMLTVEFVAETQSGDTVNDALYERNMAVADRFNINLNMIQIPGDWANRDSYMRTIRNSVQSGGSDYDLVAGVTSFIPNLVPQGIFMNINTLPHVDFSRPWWGEDWIKELSVGDKLYLVTGDVALSMWDCMFVFYFSKQLAQDNDLPNFYELVKNNLWTYDKFLELSKAVSRDINGDGIFNADDMFGFVTTTGTVVNAFPGAFNMEITVKDESNIPHPALDTGKWTDVAEKLHELHYNMPSSITLADGSDRNIIIPMFQEDRALFFPQTLSFAGDMRVMETDFGILPFPMYNEAQGKYHAVVRNAASLIGIPTTVSDPEASALILEALAAESYKTVIPAYYDISLKVKQARDDESGEMLDIIRGNLWMNFGYSYSLSAGGIGNYMRELIEAKSPNFMSAYERSFDSRAATFDTFVEDVLNLE